MDELQEAISIRPLRQKKIFPKLLVHPDSLIRYCQGLVAVEEKSNVVRYTHYTVRESLQEVYKNMLLSEGDIAKACLTYLTLDIFELGPCQDIPSIHERLDSHRFTNYVVQYWGGHTRGKPENDPEILQILLKFLLSPQKRASIRQLELPWTDRLSNISTMISSTPLHFIARNGLAIIYNFITSQSVCFQSLEGTPMSSSEIDIGKVDSVDNFRCTPLMEAAKNGHDEMVLTLIKQGAKVNVRNYSSTTLHYASLHCGKDVILALLAAGADALAKDFEGRMPLHCAALSGRKEEVAALLASGAEVEAKNIFSGWTALYYAVESGNKDVVVALLSAGAVVDVVDKRRLTPLHYATLQGGMDVMMALLNAGADVNTQDHSLETPLHDAVMHRDERLVLAILENGAHVNMQNERGRTALHQSVSDGSKEIAMELLRRDADVTLKDENGMTTLNMAAMRRDKDLAAALLKAEFKPTTENQATFGLPILFDQVYAESEFFRILKSWHPGDSCYSHLLGDALWNEDSHSAAIEAWQSAFRHDPRNLSVPDLWVEKCDSCKEMKGTRYQCTACSYTVCGRCAFREFIRQPPHWTEGHRIMSNPRPGWILPANATTPWIKPQDLEAF